MEMQLPFLQRVLGDFVLLPLLGYIPRYFRSSRGTVIWLLLFWLPWLSWLLLLAVCVAVLAYVIYTYYRDSVELPRGVTFSLLLLRMLLRGAFDGKEAPASR